MPTLSFRRGFQQPRFASGSTRPPTYPNSPGFRSKTVRPPAGVNPSAAPFMPGGGQQAGGMYEHPTTSLVPPQFQHRIFVQTARQRPQPSFNPPPSVVEQREAARSSPTALGAPAFPPLPGGNAAPKNVPSGPSLASIVTRAVLSPTSAALGPQGGAAPLNNARPTGFTSPAPSPSQPGFPVSDSAVPADRGEFHAASPTGWHGQQQQQQQQQPPPWADRSSPHSSGGGAGPSRKGTNSSDA